MFSPFSLFVFLFSSLHYHTCMFFLFPRRVPSDLEVGYEKSILTRTETFSITICFKEPLSFITFFSQENMFLSAIYFHKYMKLGPDKFFMFRDSQKLFATKSVEKSKANTPEKFACSLLRA